MLSSAICVASVICYSVATAHARAAAVKPKEPNVKTEVKDVPATIMEPKVVKQAYSRALVTNMDAQVGA